MLEFIFNFFIIDVFTIDLSLINLSDQWYMPKL